MDFQSRDRERRAVEELAPPTGDGQLRIALRAVESARQAAETGSMTDRAAHVGYHLVDEGRRTLEADIGATAAYECAGGGCRMDCDLGAICALDCSGGGCDVTCDADSTCTVSCSDDGEPCTVSCENGGRGICTGGIELV